MTAVEIGLELDGGEEDVGGPSIPSICSEILQILNSTSKPDVLLNMFFIFQL